MFGGLGLILQGARVTGVLAAIQSEVFLYFRKQSAIEENGF